MEGQDMNRSADIAARRKAAQQAQKRRKILSALCWVLASVLVLCVLGFVFILRYNPLLDELTVEAGSVVTPEQFLVSQELLSGRSIYFKTNMSGIDLKQEGDYELEIYVDGKPFSTVMHVRDTVAPKADPFEMTMDVGILPAPEFLVTNVQDVGHVTASYQKEPDYTVAGESVAQVMLTDTAGNTSIINVKVTFFSDEVPPVIEGVSDRMFFVGDNIIYTGAYTDFEGDAHSEIVATDDNGSVTLDVERDSVDTTKAGTYPIVYVATDAAGNETKISCNIILQDKPDSYVDVDVVYDLARTVLDGITTEDMSDMEVAFAIYKWVSLNIGYVGTSDKSSWTGAAHQAFTQYSGDCYNYFAAAKALFDVAEIENIDIVKEDTTHSEHYWSLINLGDGWYHVDCTPRNNPGFFFMNTDAELEAYSVQNRDSHNFNSDLYPERATESVQHLVDYANGKILD